MPNFGTVKACPKCEATDVIIRFIYSWGPREVMEWNDEEKRFKYVGLEGESELYHVLDCGHHILQEDFREEEKPTTVRWYPEERKSDD